MISFKAYGILCLHNKNRELSFIFKERNEFSLKNRLNEELLINKKLYIIL